MSSVSGAVSGLREFTFGIERTGRIQLFEKAFVATLLIYILDRSLHPLEWLTDAGFHYPPSAQSHWLPTPPPLLHPAFVPAFLVVFFYFMIQALRGQRTLAMLIGTWVCLVYVTFLDPASAFSINKLYIAGLTVLICARLTMYLKNDVGFSNWGLRILQATLIVHYFASGWCKAAHGNWLEDPYTLWSQAQGPYMTDTAAFLLNYAPREMWIVLQHWSLILELGAPIFFTIPRIRPLIIVWGFAFHLGIAFTMYKLILFSAQMMTFYVLFMPNSWIKKIESALAYCRSGVKQICQNRQGPNTKNA